MLYFQLLRKWLLYVNPGKVYFVVVDFPRNWHLGPWFITLLCNGQRKCYLFTVTRKLKNMYAILSINFSSRIQSSGNHASTNI